MRLQGATKLLLAGLVLCCGCLDEASPEPTDFEQAGPSNLIVYGAGWYNPETGPEGEHWRWMDQESRLQFFHSGTTGITLLLSGRVDRTNLGGSTRVELRLAGHRLDRFVVRQGEFYRRIELPPAWLDPAGFTELEIRCDRSFRPGESGSDDPRRLSLMMETVRILEPPPPEPRTLVIGLDGADWRLAHPLIRRGRMPALEAMGRHGRRGVLHSMEPTRSPVLWTTMATGKRPETHGISDFLLNQVPVTSNLRRVKALWNIVGQQFGRTVGCIAWYVTWPVEPIRGYMVSDRFVEWTLQRTYHPEGLNRALQEQGVQGPHLDDLDRFIPFSFRPGYRSRLAPESPERLRADLVNQRLAWVHHRDELAHRMGCHLADRCRTSLTLIYYRGVDFTSHGFWRYMDPRTFTPTELDQEILPSLARVVPSYYSFLDEKISDWIDRADPATNLLVLSDHGFQPQGPGASRELSGIHRPEGLLAAAGPWIRRSTDPLEGASILDVTPTILYLLGLPSARDMDGRLLEGLIDPKLLASRPPETVETYEDSASPPVAEEEALPSGADEGIRERLRALGYID